MRHLYSRKLYSLAAVAVTLAMLASCSSGAKKGGAIGGAVGAGTGAVIGHQKGKTGTGAIVGGAVGAAAGAIIGDYLDRQKKDLEKVPGADVKREDDRLIVTFENKILFDFDSYSLRSEAQDNLLQMAKVLNDYPDTNILVIGHTDNVGTMSYNQQLSERRASSVKGYLGDRGVRRSRMQARGYGETAPVASNADESGRSQNRRVEVQIEPNEQLKERAMDQAAAQTH